MILRVWVSVFRFEVLGFGFQVDRMLKGMYSAPFFIPGFVAQLTAGRDREHTVTCRFRV